MFGAEFLLENEYTIELLSGGELELSGRFQNNKWTSLKICRRDRQEQQQVRCFECFVRLLSTSLRIQPPLIPGAMRGGCVRRLTLDKTLFIQNSTSLPSGREKIVKFLTCVMLGVGDAFSF